MGWSLVFVVMSIVAVPDIEAEQSSKLHLFVNNICIH